MIVKCPSDEAHTIGAFICDHLQENRAQRRPYQKKICTCTLFGICILSSLSFKTGVNICTLTAPFCKLIQYIFKELNRSFPDIYAHCVAPDFLQMVTYRL